MGNFTVLDEVLAIDHHSHLDGFVPDKAFNKFVGTKLKFSSETFAASTSETYFEVLNSAQDDSIDISTDGGILEVPVAVVPSIT